MNTRLDAWRIAGKLLKRSRCRFKVGAVLTDRKDRVIAWGWNNAGPEGLGLCAERHALSRANPARLAGATIHVRAFNGVNTAPSIPCRTCHDALRRAGISRIEYAEPNAKARILAPLDRIAAASAAYILRHRNL